MMNAPTDPPRWADALLRMLVRRADAESIPGDLLEEYREVRRPTLGRVRADAWYVRHVLSVLGRVIAPCAMSIAAFKLSVLGVKIPGNRSLVQAPGVSLVEAAIYLCGSFYASRRTGRTATGVVVTATASALGFAMVFGLAEIREPDLIVLAVQKPIFLLIPAAVFVIALSFAVVFGTMGGALGRVLPRADSTPRTN
jgi:hypothetical protein